MTNKAPLTKATVLSFLLTFILCFGLIGITVYNRIVVERLSMEQLISVKTSKAQEVISRLLYKTQTLSALVLQSDGAIKDFDRVAATILDDPSILNLLIAPDGVVSNVYPLKGNEAVLGLDFFKEGAGNKEAVMAKETGELVLGGPFDLVQGGQALVGRLPIFEDIPNGSKRFWGLTSVTLKYPEVLEAAELAGLQSQGFAYEIWRINPDNGVKQIITESGYNYNKHTRYIEKGFSILNAEWYFRILPVRAWYEYPETWVLVFLSTCVSFLVAFVMRNNETLMFLNVRLESMAHTDSLTGISNRRHFFDIAPTYIERALRLKAEAYILIFDVDHFKNINDKYGHMAGDETLKRITEKVKSMLRCYDLFARYGGEEFIILVTDANCEAVRSLAERIRMEISETPVVCAGGCISVTVSFGVAPANDLSKAIELADQMLYKAKKGGRNKVVCCTSCWHEVDMEYCR